MSRQGLEHTADYAAAEITQKCRLSVGLGAMSGLLDTVIVSLMPVPETTERREKGREKDGNRTDLLK